MWRRLSWYARGLSHVPPAAAMRAPVAFAARPQGSPHAAAKCAPAFLTRPQARAGCRPVRARPTESG